MRGWSKLPKIQSVWFVNYLYKSIYKDNWTMDTQFLNMLELRMPHRSFPAPRYSGEELGIANPYL